MKPDAERVQNLLVETVTMMCQNGLPFQDELRVQGLLGITLDNDHVYIVQIDEKIRCSDTLKTKASVGEPPSKMTFLTSVSPKSIGNKSDQGCSESLDLSLQTHSKISECDKSKLQKDNSSQSLPQSPQYNSTNERSTPLPHFGMRTGKANDQHNRDSIPKARNLDSLLDHVTNSYKRDNHLPRKSLEDHLLNQVKQKSKASDGEPKENCEPENLEINANIPAPSKICSKLTEMLNSGVKPFSPESLPNNEEAFEKDGDGAHISNQPASKAVGVNEKVHRGTSRRKRSKPISRYPNLESDLDEENTGDSSISMHKTNDSQSISSSDDCDMESYEDSDIQEVKDGTHCVESEIDRSVYMTEPSSGQDPESGWELENYPEEEDEITYSTPEAMCSSWPIPPPAHSNNNTTSTSDAAPVDGETYTNRDDLSGGNNYSGDSSVYRHMASSRMLHRYHETASKLFSKPLADTRFRCTYPGCNRTFVHTRNLRQHETKQHGRVPPIMRRSIQSNDKPHCCPIPGCDKRFFHVQSIRRHINLSHGISNGEMAKWSQ